MQIHQPPVAFPTVACVSNKTSYSKSTKSIKISLTFRSMFLFFEDEHALSVTALRFLLLSANCFCRTHFHRLTQNSKHFNRKLVNRGIILGTSGQSSTVIFS
ncbi:hypothetical protein CEXT_522311 [Caerostris extrusa]|uniref:Uncharacterized protein n=1 Tax=Caerostris extrusa TaxID=172846 RepID=A0AAV4M4X8_CAEEX|nr:hypothetical protein CEXT_522311 [Caerostris extrusa]